jgi:drug/metabolite transporter (DMT)-like permease
LSVLILLLILGCALLNAVAQLTLRLGMLAGPALPAPSDLIGLALGLASRPLLWAGLICYGLSLLGWIYVLSKVPVGVAYPMGSIGYVMAAVLGVALLGESVSPMRLLGILVICLGVYLISRTA